MLFRSRKKITALPSRPHLAFPQLAPVGLSTGKSGFRHLRHPGHAFVAQDRILDCRATGPRWLLDPCVADLVADGILIGDRERHFYRLGAWVVMPNHAHLLILPLVPIPVLMRWLKGSTARKANQILGRTGHPFWQDESWDHYLRSSTQIERTTAYVEQNPVSAGLVNSPECWRWSSAGWQAKPPAPPNLAIKQA